MVTGTRIRKCAPRRGMRQIVSKGKKATIHQHQVVLSQPSTKVYDGRVLGESLGEQFESKAKTGEYGAQSHDLGLWPPGVAAHGAGLAEEANHIGSIGQVHVGAVYGQHPPLSFPTLRCAKSKLIPTDQ